MGSLKQIVRNFIAKQASRVLSLDDDCLVFGQQHYGLQEFFSEKHGQSHTLLVDQLPHYLFLKNHLDDPHGDHVYSQYLDQSWTYHFGKENLSERCRRKIDEFVQLYESIAAQKELNENAFQKPITVCQRPDGRLIIIHGNHRVAIAKKLGLSIKAQFISPQKHLRQVALVPDEFYGSERMDMPYQSIFEGETELVSGRRPDIRERIQLMDQGDLKGKTVLDLGCNIGNNCFVAVQAGATSAAGVDYSPKLISAAIRLNSYFAADCSFYVYDLNKEMVDVESADTVFCFSLVKHLQQREGLYQTILNKTKNVLYFEGHAHASLADYEALLNQDNFSSIDLIGYTRNGIHNKKRNRPLFRCERNRT